MSARDDYSTQLGLNLGTAQGRLRALVFFDLVQRAGEDMCFRCKDRIEKGSELSIDHKESWLLGGAHLFWREDNLAFSHLRCNVAEIVRGTKRGQGKQGENVLGMAKATAFHRLRRRLTFRLLAKVHGRACYRCEQTMTEADFSLDHITDWRHVDVALFWALTNIAFSHKRCNSMSQRPELLKAAREKMSKIGPEGTAWCYGHQAFLSGSEFQVNAAKRNGFQNLCKTCRVPPRKSQYERDKAVLRASANLPSGRQFIGR